MNYIIIDLEWNQPVSFETRIFKSIGHKLMFELIQIGAVKLNSNREMVDAISIPIKPTHYKVIHPRIRRLTNFKKSHLEHSPYFPEAMERFKDWCGENYVLITWGDDDVSVLHQNINFFKWIGDTPPIYDLQRYFSILLKLKERRGLKAAMELFDVEQDENLGFHNALNDAYYTARIFQKISDPNKILNYEVKPKKLGKTRKRRLKRRTSITYGKNIDIFKKNEIIQHNCPYCNKKMTIDKDYVKINNKEFKTFAQCPIHGNIAIKMTLENQKYSNRITFSFDLNEYESEKTGYKNTAKHLVT